MKNLIAIFSSMLILLGSCAKEVPPTWGNRLDAIEKALIIKDAQIAGLSEIAYIQSLDTVSFVNDSFNLAALTFKDFHLVAPAPCRANCARIMRRHLNICQHVAPQNYTWCIQQAIRNYSTCLGRCN